MPSLNQVAPAFYVADVGATARWYQSKLGFQIHPFPSAEPYVFARLTRDGVELMLLGVPGYVKPVVHRPAGIWDAYFRVTGLYALYDEVRAVASVTSALTHRGYGLSEFEVTDPNGYVLAFAEPTPVPAPPLPGVAIPSAQGQSDSQSSQPAAASTGGEFVDVADVASLPPGKCRTVEVRGRRYAIFNIDGAFHAIDDACPHRGGPLGAGYVEGHEVYCPLHGWPFDVRTGACRTMPNRPVRTHPVRVEDGRVWLAPQAAEKR